MTIPFYIPTNYNPLHHETHFLSPELCTRQMALMITLRTFILPQPLHILTNACYFLFLLIAEQGCMAQVIGMWHPTIPLTGGASPEAQDQGPHSLSFQECCLLTAPANGTALPMGWTTANEHPRLRPKTRPPAWVISAPEPC